jgi:tryptophan synthase alpha chain
MQRALAAGGGMDSALATVRDVRARGCVVPVVLFGYYNPIFVRGVDRFAAEAADAGVDAVLTVDLPMDELRELSEPLANRGVGVVPLVAPTSGLPRVERVREFDPPFVYYISMTGITGAEHGGFADVRERVAAVRTAAGAPVAVGFGIKSPQDARTVGDFADGVVVGSAAVQAVESGGGPELARYVGTLAAALRDPRR